ncbi:hypothetical protein F5Y06DRAFT_307870 [Hypoxylon sp. FL0890]|nr:hypothetical protein F5Y06DRAFT_307870 [Hypoxylon sp. FL0890]
MDISPFAILESPALVFIYCGLAVYIGICLTLGYKVSRAHFSPPKHRLIPIPPWLLQTIIAIIFSIIFAILIIPFAFVVGIWTLFKFTGRVWYGKFGQWRKRRRGERVGVEMTSWGQGAGSWTTIDGIDDPGQVEHLPDYSRYGQDARVDVYTAGPLLNPPPPAYFHGRDHGAASRQ